MSKPTILFFCYRLIEFRLFINSKLLSYCSKNFTIIFAVPESAIEDCKKLVSNDALVIASNYPSNKMLNVQKATSIKTLLENFFRNILALTYAENEDYEKCLSQKFQMISSKNAYSKRSLLSKISINLIIFIAKLASKYKIYRKLLKKIMLFFLKNDYHKDIFFKYKPDLVVVGSMGLDADGYAIYEAKKHKIKSVVINQSWDRTVCKGYPVILPDEFIVWNFHMKEEAKYYLEMPENNVHVCGSPVWDFLFNKDKLISKKDFIEKMNLNPNKPIIYYPMSSAFWHNDLLNNISEFYEAYKSKKLNNEIQIIFRVHPYYWINDKKRKELFIKLDEFKKIKNFYVDYNQVIKGKEFSFLKLEDQNFLLNCYNHSDLCISVTSSSMVEMVLTGKPSVNFLYGDWLLDNEKIKMKDYVLHHLEKFYDYNIIKHVYNFEELIDAINNFSHLKINHVKKNNFIKGEFPINRGNSAQAYSDCLLSFIKK